MDDDEYGLTDIETERFHLERFDPDYPEAEPPAGTDEVSPKEIIEVEKDLKTQRRTDIEDRSARIDSTVLNLKLLLDHDDRDVRRVEKRLSVLKLRGEAELSKPDEPWTKQTL
jgi:hypothetical protein